MPDDPDTGGDAPAEREDHDEEATVDGSDTTPAGDDEEERADAGSEESGGSEADAGDEADPTPEDVPLDDSESARVENDAGGGGDAPSADDASESSESPGEDADATDASDGEASDEETSGEGTSEDGATSTYGPDPPDESFATPDPSGAESLLDDDDLDLEADAGTDADAEEGRDADAAGTLATDGDGAVAGTGAATGAAAQDTSFVSDGVASGPESDVEMPLTEHIEEMIRRLAVVFAVGGLVTLLLYPGANLANALFGLDLISATDVINHLWNRHIPGTEVFPDRRPRLYGPLELLLTQLKVAGLGGLVVALPVVVYESYLFMRPGLYPNERRYYLAAVPTSVVLGVVGVLFAHFAVLPAIFAYFTSYTQGAAVVAFGLRETFNLILILMGYMAVVFQIPLFIMLAIMMDLVTPQWLRDRRLLFWGGFLGLSFIATPDPTGMAPIIVAATMIVLFETTLYGLRLSGR
jgi:sec-independent protein translocase protein TatC